MDVLATGKTQSFTEGLFYMAFELGNQQWKLGFTIGIGQRPRRAGIVALARKLLIALWHYVETGVIPEGVVLKTRLI